MDVLKFLMNHSLVDDYDKQRFVTVATPVCDQGVGGMTGSMRSGMALSVLDLS